MPTRNFPPDGIPNENNGIIVSTATCPPGSKLTGGGYDNVTSTGVTISESADVDSWVVLGRVPVAEDPADADDPEELTAYADCYNSQGPVPGADVPVRKSASGLSLAVQEKIAGVAAKHSR